jgi:myosin heavy subunit
MSAKNVWSEHPDLLWDLYDVLEATETGYTLVSRSTGLQKSAVPRAAIIEVDPSHLQNSSDLCSMNSLHEAPLIDLVRRRHADSSIFSKIGSEDIILSLNPYRRIPGLFENMDAYNRPLNSVASSHLAPHIYGTANCALKSLGECARSAVCVNQSILISGESGAGKTEASKAVINFLLHCDDGSEGSESSERNSSCERVKRVISSSTAIFEAFGNAKTIKNENSSRFGKFIKINYSESNRIVSAATETFLLERSRLVTAGADERNYHIFYMLLSALGESLGLNSAEHYNILTQGSCITLTDQTADMNTFGYLLEAFDDLKFSTEEVADIWRLLAVILNLGNLKLIGVEEGKEVLIEESGIAFDQIAESLGVIPALFKKSITTSRVHISKRSSVNIRILSLPDVENNLKGLIKWLYNKLFEWLVSKINDSYKNETVAAEGCIRFIGILDIFGFEILGVNSLEQLCINYTNECLQQQFNERVFSLEQEDYIREGVDWKQITFGDNQSKIDCIAKHPTGLLQQLEEYGSLNRKEDNPDMALLFQLNQNNDKVGNTSYVKSRFKDQYFTIRHFAGDVKYGKILYYLICRIRQ